MSRLKILRERIFAGIPAEAKAIRETAEKENRDLSAEELAKVETLTAEKKSVAAEIAALEAIFDLQVVESQKEGTRPRVVVGAGPERAPWQSLGEFGTAVAEAYRPGGVMDQRLHAAITGQSQTIPADGGMLVPPQFSTAIWDEMQMDSQNLLAMTDQYTVDGESLTFTANAETSRAIGSLYGGVQAYWIAEADQITKSKLKLRQVKVEPQQLAVLIYATDKLLRNATALSQYLTRAAAASIVHEVNRCILSGLGSGQPRGIISHPATVSVAKETNQAAATIVQENVSKMWARLAPGMRRNAVWLHNVDIEPQLDFLSTVVKNVAGTENVGGYANKVFDAERRTLKGRPLVACEWCETLGTVGDLVLWDPKSYLAGVRGGIQSAMSMHLRFDFAETAFRFLFEVDGTPWLASAITPAKGSATLTSQVTVATRS